MIYQRKGARTCQVDGPKVPKMGVVGLARPAGLEPTTFRSAT